jgi:predicted house-cleaning noncanonical NTP pyrophosphatase (MazG superfamily)
MIEVIYVLAQLQDVSPEQLEEVRKKKALERGVFLKRLIITYEK